MARRGAPLGNRNRVTHGLRTREMKEMRAAVRACIAEMKIAAALVKAEASAILRQHPARQIQRSADQDARRRIGRMRARPGVHLHHRVLQIVGGRGVEAHGARSIIKLARAARGRFAVDLHRRHMPRQTTERLQESARIFRLQHAADQIEWLGRTLFEIRHCTGNSGGAVRIVPAIEPDFGIRRRQRNQRALGQALQPRRPFHLAQSGFDGAFHRPTRPRMAQGRDGDGRVNDLLSQATEAGYLAGIPLGQWYPQFDDCFLVTVTEKRTKAEIDGLAEVLSARGESSTPKNHSRRSSVGVA